VSLIGVPTDIGASTRGGSMGPAALRIAGIAEALAGMGFNVADRGDLSGPFNPMRPPVNGYRHLQEVVTWNQALHDACLAELAIGRMPVMLGGDHCLAIGSISAAARHCRTHGRRLKVIWLDAHADFNTAELTPTGNLHGMPVACLMGFGPDELVRLSGDSPAIVPAQLSQIGIRSVDEGEKHFLDEQRLQVFDMRQIDEIGMRKVMEHALADVGADTHLHVSFDVDFLDPSIAPGVGTTVRGGPGYREAQLCMEMLADAGCLGSLDIVELNPALDHGNATAELAVDLLQSLFGKSTLVRLARAG
jgi:arginase